MADDDYRGPQTDTALATVPAASNIPAPEESPPYQQELNNLAGDKELADAYRAWAAKQIEHFKTQRQRKAFCDGFGSGSTATPSTMDVADRMWRVALRRDENSDQHADTGSDVTSTAYFRAVRTITAGEVMVFFDGKHLPAEFEPELNTDEYEPAAGEMMAAQQNRLEEYTFDEDKRSQKLKELFTRVNKYGNYMVGVEWAEEWEERDGVRTPVEFDPDGKPTKFEWRTVRRKKRGWPTLKMYDPKDCFFDAQIDGPDGINDMDLQRCFAIRLTQVPWEQLQSEHTNGQIKNLDKIRPTHFYTGAEHDEVQKDRNANAGHDATPEANGMFEVWHVWGMVPVKEYKGTRRGKGRWNADEVPARYWATYVGDIASGTAVCVRLIKNPYTHGKVPYKFIHSHRDDNGAYHMGFPTMLPSLYWQATTNINQGFDNVSLIVKSPWLLDGPMMTRPGKWRANKIIRIGRGTVFKQPDVRDATGTITATADRIERDIERTTGADKPILGEALGSRTSATEAKQVLDQSLVPLDDKAGYVADQLFPWMLELDCEDWRQFGDPDDVLRVTHSNSIVDIYPTRLWGPIRTKVTAVNRFRNSVQRRQEINSFLQNGYAGAAPEMDKPGRRNFWRWVFDEFGIERPEMYFPMSGSVDAEQRAVDAGYKILRLGQWQEPKPDEDHRTWISVLTKMLEEYRYLPEADQANIQMLQEHMAIRKNFEAAMDQSRQAMAAGQGAAPQQGLPGEIGANPLEAAEGAVANL